MSFQSDFERDGVVIARNVLAQSTENYLTEAWRVIKEQLKRGERVRDARFVRGELGETLDLLHEHLYFVETLTALLGTDDFGHDFTRLLLKDAKHNEAVTLHQDVLYFKGLEQKLSVFVPITPIKAGQGGLRFVKGSHKYGLLPKSGTIRREVFPPMEDMDPDLAPGDVVFMDLLTWHYSESGTDEDRPLIQIVYKNLNKVYEPTTARLPENYVIPDAQTT